MKKYLGSRYKNKTVVDIEIGTEDNSHIWSYTKPIWKKSPNNSDLMKAPASTPVGTSKFPNPIGKRNNSKK